MQASTTVLGGYGAGLLPGGYISGTADLAGTPVPATVTVTGLDAAAVLDIPPVSPATIWATTPAVDGTLAVLGNVTATTIPATIPLTVIPGVGTLHLGGTIPAAPGGLTVTTPPVVGAITVPTSDAPILAPYPGAYSGGLPITTGINILAWTVPITIPPTGTPAGTVYGVNGTPGSATVPVGTTPAYVALPLTATVGTTTAVLTVTPAIGRTSIALLAWTPRLIPSDWGTRLIR